MHPFPYYFQDYRRLVDFILIYEPKDDDRTITQKREYFLKNLADEGLEFEEEVERGKFNFYKIHVPYDVLLKYCDVLQIKMPIRQDIILDKRRDENSVSVEPSDYYTSPDSYVSIVPEKPRLYAEFLTGRLDLFDVNSKDFFTPALRSMIANIALNKIQFTMDEEDIGLERVIEEKIFKTAFPLHDGSLDDSSERAQLLENWGSFNKIFSKQPVDQIKEYFGVKVALYFLWLGFYTTMLIPASIFGIICLIFGGATVTIDQFSNEVCDAKNITMCPLCPGCNYWDISDACPYAKANYVFDNYFTVIFAILMSLWSMLYLELWKRYSSKITHHWGMSGFDLQSEYPRPEYLAKLKEKKKISFWKQKFPLVFFSFSVALLVASLAVMVVFSVIIYRMAIRTATDILKDDQILFSTIFVPFTAGLMNIVPIFILNKFYDFLAVKLTQLEYQRTQAEFDNSLSLKIYIFQFVNYYSSIFYIAFIKGNLAGYPEHYRKVFGYRVEQCSPGGCLMELCIQLAIIMIGKQIMNNIFELMFPYLAKKIKVYVNKERVSISNIAGVTKQVLEDYELKPWNSLELFPEYLEMVIQYGFVTIFVTAFPLAPLLALINNIIEIRLDAKKFLTYYRRPVAERVKDIGVWFRVINAVSILSVVTNACIIAFSSEFVQKLVYLKIDSNSSYLDFSLSYLHVLDLDGLERPSASEEDNYDWECRYKGFRTPYNDDDPNKNYLYTKEYWHVLTAKLAFIVVYQNFVGLMIMVVQYAIPDVPKKIKRLIKQETVHIKNYLIKNYSKRKNFNPSDSVVKKITIEDKEYAVMQ